METNAAKQRGPRGFDVVADPVVNPVTPAELPYIRLFQTEGKRLPRGAWGFYNATGALGVPWAWMGVIGPIAGLIALACYGIFSDRGRNEPWDWKLPSALLLITLFCGFVVYKSLVKLRRLVEAAIVVPARVVKIPLMLPGGDDPIVDFVLNLYGNQHPVEVSVARSLAKKLQTGQETQLIVDPTTNPFQCYFQPRWSERASLVAAANTARFQAEPVAAEPVGPSVEAELPAVIAFPSETGAVGSVIELRYTLSFDDLSELQSTLVVSEPIEFSSWRSQAVAWAVFIGLALALVAIVKWGDSGSDALLGWPLRDNYWADVLGLAVFVLGCVVCVRAGKISNRAEELEIAFRCDELGFVTETSHARCSFAWAHFDRFAESPRLFVLTQVGKAGLAIPKRAFNNDALRLDFADRLRRHLPRVTKEVKL